MAEGNLTYKEEHERFVSGHNGTSLLEISLLASSSPLTLLLREAALLMMAPSLSSKPWVRFVVDFLFLVMSLVFGCTILADKIPQLLILYILTFITILLLSRSMINAASLKSSWNVLLNTALPTRLTFVTHFRSFVNVATAIFILAVDFKVFPRRFCKAETFGTGLMDVGVASFVVANAIVSPEARGKHTLARDGSEVVRRLARSVTSSLPLWVLGFCRLIAVKGIDYHEHVSEYGLHWNFFFTLAIVRVASTLIMCLVSHSVAWLLALTLSGLYEIWLHLGLRDFILFGFHGDDSRTGLFDANREGIFSCFGYLAIYFAGVQLGKYLLLPRQTLRSWFEALLVLSALDVILWVSLIVSQDKVDPVSRRLANLSYVIWMMAYCVQSLVQFLAVDLISFAYKELKVFARPAGDKDTGIRETGKVHSTFNLLEAINRNALFYFLLANLLTGAVNMIVDTLNVVPTQALILISMYLLVLSTVTALLHLHNFTIKFW